MLQSIMKQVCVLLMALCLSVTFTDGAFGLDGAVYTYVDRVVTLRDKRQVEQPATESPIDLTTPHNITETSNETDPENHNYYEARYMYDDDGMWIDMESLTNVTTVSSRLSSSTQHAVRVQLPFYFPFYGYNTSFVYVASGGFLYAGTYPHSYLAATQYIAPLMANFNPSVDPASTISYYGNESFFVAEWKNLRLEGDSSGKNFSFQALIFKNGTLVFSYKDLPIRIEDIPSSQHPVKVGVSDAYYHDTTIIPGLITRRTIYLYHVIMLNFSKVDEASAVILTPQETCTSRRTCSECTLSPPPNFNCVWCPVLSRCSDGFDRNRQDWSDRNCHHNNRTVCKSKPTPQPTKAPTKDACPEDCGMGHCSGYKCICPDGYSGRTCQLSTSDKLPQGQTKSHAGLIVFMVLLITIIVVISGWVGYAYRNPNTPSGLYLIKITRCYFFKKNGSTSHSYKYERTAENI